jgi:hypothetical protein
MRERLSLVLVTTLLVASLPLSASAATVDAEQFADMCNTAPGGPHPCLRASQSNRWIRENHTVMCRSAR